jgi:hypothetical protein
MDLRVWRKTRSVVWRQPVEAAHTHSHTHTEFLWVLIWPVWGVVTVLISEYCD